MSNLKDIAIFVVIAVMVAFTVVVIRNQRVPAEILSPVAPAPAVSKSGAVVPNPALGASAFTPVTLGRAVPSSAPVPKALSIFAASPPAAVEPSPQAAETTEPETPVPGEVSYTARTSASSGGAGRTSSVSAPASRSVVFTSEPAAPAATASTVSSNSIYGGSSIVKLRQSRGGYALQPSANPSSTDADNKIQFETNSGASSAAPASSAT